MGSFSAVLAADGEQGEWLLEELSRMLAVGLVDPFIWLDDSGPMHGSDPDDPRAVLYTPDGPSVEALSELLARRSGPGIIRLVRMVLPGTEGPDLEGVRGRLERLHGSDVISINLLVPTEDLQGEDRGPVVSRDQLLPAWRNIVVSPEDATPSTYVTVEVSDRVIPHAAAAVACVAGAWVAQDGSSPLDQMGSSGNTQTCTLLRCSTRSLVVAQRADMAVGRALRMAHPVARTVVRDEELVREASDETARAWSVHAADRWLLEKNHPFRFGDPSPPIMPVAEYLGVRGTWRLLVDYLFRRLPKAVKSDIDQTVDSARARLGNAVSGKVFDDDAAYRFSFTERGSTQQSPEGEVGSIDRLDQRLVNWVEMNGGLLGASAEPGVWKELRSVSLGLLDAGPLPADLELPPNRHIVGNPARVFGPVIGPQLLIPRARELLPPVDHLLRTGDLAGLGDVRGLVAAMLRRAGVMGAEDATQADSEEPDERWLRRVAGLLVAAGLIVAVWLLWKRPLAEPGLWYAVGGSVAGMLLGTTGVRRWRKPPREVAVAAQQASSDGGDAPELSEDDILVLEAQLEALDSLDVALRGSFAGRVAERLIDEIESAVHRADGMRQIVRAPVAASQTKSERARGWLSRFLRAAARPAVAAVGLAAIVFLLLTLPLAARGLIVVGTLLVAGWIFMVLRWVLRYVRRKWLESVRLPAGESDLSWASRAVYHVLTEVARLHRSYTVLIEWVGLLDRVTRDPFGPPAESPDRETPMTLRRLHGHQIAHGNMDELTLDRIVSGLEEELLRPGWLGASLETLRSGSIADYKQRFHIKNDTKADPDLDEQPGFTDLRSPRSHLRKWISDPVNSFSVRVALIRHGFEWMSAQAPSELLAGIANRAVSANEFLTEILTAPHRGFLSTLFEHGYSPPEVASHAWLPAPILEAPSDTRSKSGVSPSVLLYQSALMEWIASVKVDHLLLIGPERAEIDPESIRPSEELTDTPIPQLDAGDIEQNRERQIRMLDDFPEGSLIVPTGEPSVPKAGQYSFLMVVDGEPLRFPFGSPIAFEVRKAGGPADGLEMVRQLLQELAGASGMSFRFMGLTDRFPGYGADGAARPLWIGWVYPEDDLVGSEPVAGGGGESILGRGGVRSFEPYGGEAYLSPGVATVRADLDYTQAFGADGVRAVLLHELGHAMNLGHVDDPNEIMYPTYAHGARSTLGQGDRRGLWLLGSGR